MDRNSSKVGTAVCLCLSLSARRAWIEMLAVRCQLIAPWVALRKESVDRNYLDLVSGELRLKSLSARRAWIEMQTADEIKTEVTKSLSARRAWIEIVCHI